MIDRRNCALIRHIKEHALLYIIVVTFFFFGIFCGCYVVKHINASQQGELLNYLDVFLKGLSEWDIDPGAAAQHAVLNNLKIVLYIWFLGLTVIGIPLVLLIVFARGFVMGFTVGFLVQQKGGAGILIAVLAILPPSLLNIPALIVGAAFALTFSGWLVRGRYKYENSPLFKFLGAYCAVMLLIALVSAAAGFIEVYISPTFLQFFTKVTGTALL
jgi:stage II sporulation protein M